MTASTNTPPIGARNTKEPFVYSKEVITDEGVAYILKHGKRQPCKICGKHGGEEHWVIFYPEDFKAKMSLQDRIDGDQNIGGKSRPAEIDNPRQIHECPYAEVVATKAPPKAKGYYYTFDG